MRCAVLAWNVAAMAGIEFSAQRLSWATLSAWEAAVLLRTARHASAGRTLAHASTAAALCAFFLAIGAATFVVTSYAATQQCSSLLRPPFYLARPPRRRAHARACWRHPTAASRPE